MVNAIHVRNYRSFQGRSELELRPITLLLGRNSSGKSSLTRLFPLLQQSIETPSSTPILWSADLVDLGNINDVKTHNSTEDLEIGFSISDSRIISFISRFNYRFYYHYPEFPPRKDASTTSQVNYTIILANEGTRTVFKGLKLSINDHTVHVEVDAEGFVTQFRVDGNRYSIDGQRFFVDTKSLLPRFERINKSSELSGRFNEEIFYDRIIQAVTSITHGRTSQQKIKFTAASLPYIAPATAKDNLLKIANVAKKKVNDTNAKLISDISLINALPAIAIYLNNSLSQTFRSSAYIGPLRASGKRFDRIQELAVNRLDSSGENTAMYLYSLKESELASFNDLLSRACGSMVAVQESGPGHVSIQIGSGSSTNFENIADVGFGFSQLLPVVAQLHALNERSFTDDRGVGDSTAIFAVEQPELHLHPALQGNLADLFVSAFIKDSNQKRRALSVIETHSEALISRLGALVSSGEVPPDDIALYFVEKSDHSSESTVRRSFFNADGIVEDWPVGFFSR